MSNGNEVYVVSHSDVKMLAQIFNHEIVKMINDGYVVEIISVNTTTVWNPELENYFYTLTGLLNVE